MLFDHQAGTSRAQRSNDDRTWQRAQVLARVLTIVWAGFCALAIVGDVLDRQASPDLTATEQVGMIGAALLLLGTLAALPWRWERLGGALLVLAGALPWLMGLLGMGARPWEIPPSAILLLGVFLGVLPLSAGGLFLLHDRVQQQRQARA